MGRVACRSCGHAWPDDTDLAGGFRVACTGCGTRFYVTLDAAVPPDAQREWLDEEPEACLVCGGRLDRSGQPPCERCGSTAWRPAGP